MNCLKVPKGHIWLCSYSCFLSKHFQTVCIITFLTILDPLTVIAITLGVNENVAWTIKTSISPSHFSPTLAKPTWAIQLTDVITIRTLQKEGCYSVTVLENYKWQVTTKLNLKDLSSSVSIRICFRRRRRKNDWDKCIFYLYAYGSKLLQNLRFRKCKIHICFWTQSQFTLV